MRMRSFLALLAAASLLAALAVAAQDPAARCTAAKLKAAAKKTSSKLKCHATAAARGSAVDPACLGKAEEKFSAAWARAEARGGCAPSLSESTVESRVDACVA